MHVTHLSLTDFRSYEVVDLTFDPGVTALIGPNGQGKTNLVEAVGYLSTLGSHRVTGDAALIRAGEESAIIRATVMAGGREAIPQLGGSHVADTSSGYPGRLGRV